MSSTDATRLGQAAHGLMQRVIGQTIADVSPIRMGLMTTKYKMTSAAGEIFVLRIYPAHRSFVCDYEPQAWIALRASGMRVPEVIAYSQCGPPFEFKYVAYKMIPGTCMADRLSALDASSLGRIARSVIAQLAYLSVIPTTGFGHLVGPGAGAFTSLPAFLTSSLHEAVDGPADDAFTDLRRVAAKLLACPETFPDPACPELCWTDISPENIILNDRDRLAGLVDFESLMNIEPIASLGYLKVRFFGTAFYESFRNAWDRPVDTEARVSFYAAIRAARLAPYASRPTPNGSVGRTHDELLPGLSDSIRILDNRLWNLRL